MAGVAGEGNTEVGSCGILKMQPPKTLPANEFKGPTWVLKEGREVDMENLMGSSNYSYSFQDYISLFL